jgi:hypothetical protein
LAVFAIFVGSSELLFIEHASVSAKSSFCSSLLPNSANFFAFQEMSGNSSTSPFSNPLALGMESSSFSVHGASLTLSIEGFKWLSMLGVSKSSKSFRFLVDTRHFDLSHS